MALVLRLCCCTFEVRMREVGLLHSTVEAKTVQQTGRGSSPFFEHWLLICWGSSVFASCSCHSLTKTGNNKRSCRKRDNIDLEVLVIQSCPFWGHLCCSDTWTSRFPAPRPRFQRWTFLSILGNFGSWLAWMAGFQMPHRAFPLRLHPWSLEGTAICCLPWYHAIPCVCLGQVKKIRNRPGIVPFYAILLDLQIKSTEFNWLVST